MNDWYAKSKIRYKAAIHHIQMDIVSTALFNILELIGQTGKI